MKNTLCSRKVSSFGLGTWKMGGGQTPDYGHDTESIMAIRYAIDSGINVIDTAEMYAGGHSEEIVGKAISTYDRKNIFIISKVWNDHLTHDALLDSARKSAARLGTNYIDLYLIHWPNPNVPIKETITAMEELVSSGLTKNIGVSNFSLSQLKEAMDATERTRICANQIEYNYSNRDAENELIPFCEENGIDVIAYTPIMRGKTAKYQKLAVMAEKYGVTPVQMSLRYVMEKAFAIPKSSNPAHIDELLTAAKITLKPEDYKELSILPADL
ncbi:MAG: aldo/keto reductase [Candidatus Thermoplasmatota archaeon]|nr:aldo/keto reductase [Candidatus Thermoplasmatota archaeon]